MLPPLYHAHHTRNSEDIPFWLELASQQGSPILELGCGTGRVLMELVNAGRQVFGLDNDPEMLSYLRSRLPVEGPQPAGLYLADMSAFHLDSSFALIITPCNTWSTLSADVRTAALVCVRHSLKPGGLFAASLPNPALLLRLPPESEAEVEDAFVHPLTGQAVQVSSAWQRTSRHFRLFWYYDLLYPDGQVKRLPFETAHFLEPASTYLDELAAAGFKAIHTYGDYDRSPYSSRSPSLILLASY